MNKTEQFVERPIEFAGHRLATDGQLRTPRNQAIQLPRRLARLLYELGVAQGGVVSRQGLLERCWPGESVSDESLSRAVSDLRQVLADLGPNPIEVVYGLGYRLNLPGSQHESAEAARRIASLCRDAWHRVNERRPESLDAAEKFFTMAAEQQARSVEAWLGIAETQFHRMQLGYAASLEAWTIARAAIERALDLDSGAADAWALKGLGLVFAEWQFDEADECLQEARRIDPDSHLANECSGLTCLATGNAERAEGYFRRAIDARPAAMQAHGAHAYALMLAGRSTESLLAAREMCRLDTGSAIANGYHSMIEGFLGDASRAVASGRKFIALLPESPVARSVLAYALARAYQLDEARQLLATPPDAVGSSRITAMACPAWLALGDRHAALEALRAAMPARCPNLTSMLHDPRLAGIRDEPLFRAIYEEVLRR